MGVVIPVAPYTLEQAEEAIADLRAQVDRLGEVHALDGSGGVVPNAQPNQVQVYPGANGQPAYVGASGLQMGMVGTQQAFFPVIAVTGTSLAALASMTIPAGDAVGGAVYDIEVWGSGTAGTNMLLTFAVVLGGSTMSSVQLGANFMAAATSFRWRAVARVVCHTTGAGGTWSSLVFGDISINGTTLLTSGGASVNATNSFVSCEIATTTPADTTVAQTLSLSASWSGTTGPPGLTSRVAIPRRWC